MPVYRFTTVGPSEAGSNNQWAAFIADPFGDGSVIWGTRIVDTWVWEPGVTGYFFIDDNGQRRWDVRLFGRRANDDIAAQFRTNGASGTRLTERKRPTHDRDGNVTGEDTYASGNLTVRQWRNILLITGEGNEQELDEDLNPTGRPSSWPPELEEHQWL